MHSSIALQPPVWIPELTRGTAFLLFFLKSQSDKLKKTFGHSSGNNMSYNILSCPEIRFSYVSSSTRKGPSHRHSIVTEEVREEEDRLHQVPSSIPILKVSRSDRQKGRR